MRAAHGAVRWLRKWRALWSVAHLRAVDGVLTWNRRGSDVPASWALPEADNTGKFRVAFDFGEGFEPAIETTEASAIVPSGAIAARVAERGRDGRLGAWVSIGLGTP